jgi:hypothetical protein
MVSSPLETDAGNETGVPRIEVTPEMVEAGTTVFAEWIEISPPDLLVSKVYRAMRALETLARAEEGEGSAFCG